MKVDTMWWCPTCRYRVARPLWQNPGRPDRWAYHLAPGGRYGHGLESAPVIEGELVGAQAQRGVG
jgi:hypothetical protein